MAFEHRHGACTAALAVVLALPSAAYAGLPRDFTLHRPSTAQFIMDWDDGDGGVDRVVAIGNPGDLGLLADADGDTLADIVLYRNGLWFVDYLSDRVIDRTFVLGGVGDVPLAADFMGNGRAGFGIYRPANGLWYLDRDGNGSVDFIAPWGGVAGDIPVVADYDGDGRADRAVYRNGAWLVDLGLDTTLDAVYYLGGLAQDVPLAADFDGDWKADNAVFRDGYWFVDYGNNSTVDRLLGYGASGDRPFVQPVDRRSSLFVRAGAVGGNGTQPSPLGTIAAALAVAVPGHIIRIAAASYAEGVCFSSRQNLTFLGAGVAATHLVGANNNGCNNSFDAFAVVASQNIVLRNLHVASPSNRSIVVQGIAGGTSSATLDRVSTAGSRTHGVLAAGVSATPSTLVVESSNIDQSQIGNGVFLGGGVNATIRRSTIDDNGTAAPATDGHGLVSFLDSTLLFELGSSSFNYRTALLFDHTSVAVIRNNTFTFNGHGAVFFQKSTSGNVHNNVMDMNGILGTPGCCTGFNAVEVFGDYNGPQMLIHDNSISRSTTNGVFVASGTASVTNNVLFHNFLGVTVHGATSVNVQIHGNRFELPLAQGNEEGLLVEGSAAVVTVGGAGALQNTFVNYIDNPAIHCNPGVTATCPSGGNVFVNSNLPIIGCPASCQQ